jgi:tetratricopeptide (TPR) repeat protein/transcriptional regulator with XRE-family HTH domain
MLTLLAAELRRMRDLSGKSLKDLERATFVSDSSLSRYLSGRLLAPWSVVVALCRVVGRDPRELQPLWEKANNQDHHLGTDQPRNDLPRAVARFVGRAAEAKALRSLLVEARVICIDGMGGAGKTALALHVAHQVGAQFPDGQLYLNLHGYTQGHEPVAPSTALATLLRAVGVPAESIPESGEERAARWRTELATRRALIVIDNAVSADQVTQLLPGAGGSTALIISRHRLVELGAVASLSLDSLSHQDALALFRSSVGDERPLAEPEATEQVLRSCAFLPLAVELAAGRLRRRPMWTVGALADRLGDESRRLSELAAGNLSIAAVFAMSVRQLNPAQRRLFRLLGHAPVERFEVHLAAAVASIPVATARRLLEELVDAHLLQESRVQVYSFHDLLRQYARDLGGQEETRASLDETIDRVLGYYRQCLLASVETFGMARRPLAAAPQLPAMQLPDLSHPHATPWLERELSSIVLALRTTADAGHDTHVYALAQTLTHFFYSHIGGGTLDDRIAVDTIGLTAARRAGAVSAESWLLGDLGLASYDRRKPAEAVQHIKQAVALAAQAGDWRSEALWHATLSLLRTEAGTADDALAEAERALALCRSMDDPYGTAWMTGNLGRILAQLGHLKEGIEHQLSALDTMRALGQRIGELRQLTSLGHTQLSAQRYPEAIEYLREALALSRELADRAAEGYVLNELAVAFSHLRDFEQAAALHREAIEVVRQTGDHAQEAAFREVYDQTF